MRNVWNHLCATTTVILTLAELEASAGTGLTGFLALDLACVAGEESGCLERGAICFLVNLTESAGYAEADCLSLAFGAAAAESDLDVKLTCGAGDLKRLVHDILQGLFGKIVLQSAVVDRDVAFSGCEINASYSCFTSSKGVCLFHLLCLNFVQLDFFRVLCLVRMLRACVYEQVTEDLAAKTVLGEHTLDCPPDEFGRPLSEDLLGITNIYK